MLYDTTADVIRKALRGLDLAPSDAAKRAGLSEREVISASRGPALRETLLLLAPSLGLNGRALAGLPDYTPPPCQLSEVTRLELPFEYETVNAWLVDAGDGEFLLFDSGNDVNDARLELEELGISKVHVLITHEHGDHTGGLAGLGSRLASLSRPSSTNRAKPGDRLRFGRLEVEVIDLPGHCEGAVGYRIGGLNQPVCLTGDALFAGSIGGCAPGNPYQQALAALKNNILTLPPETILLPGHGVESTVGSERRGNPFFAG